MKKCIIWGLGEEFYKHNYLFKQYEKLGTIQIVGLVDKYSRLKQYDTWKVLKKDEIDISQIDVVVISSDAFFNSIKKDALQLGFDDKVIVNYRIFMIPLINLDDYFTLLDNIPTIFSINCWGGLTYHSLGVSFKSPFINMFLQEDDFLKFLKQPHHYLEQNIELESMIEIENPPYSYPRVRCDDILLWFNHDSSYEKVSEDWNRRKKRINFDNLVIIACSDNMDFINEFAKLPYNKKVCFVPFKTEYDCCCEVELQGDESNKTINRAVIDVAKGDIVLFKVLDLLLYGKIVKYTIDEHILLASMKAEMLKKQYEDALLKVQYLTEKKCIVESK